MGLASSKPTGRPRETRDVNLDFLRSGPAGSLYDLDSCHYTTHRQRHTQDGLTSNHSDSLACYQVIRQKLNHLSPEEIDVLEKRLRSYLNRRAGEIGHFNLMTGRWKSRLERDETTSREYALVATDKFLLQAVVSLLHLWGQPPCRTSDGSLLPPVQLVAVKPETSGWDRLRRQVWMEEFRRSRDLPTDGSSRCFCCRKVLLVTEFDCCHLVPRAHGGRDVLENLRVGCRDCNRGRGGMHDTHAYEYMLLNNSPGLTYLSPEDPMLISIQALHQAIEIFRRIPGLDPSVLIELDPSRPVRRRYLTLLEQTERLLGTHSP